MHKSQKCQKCAVAVSCALIKNAGWVKTEKKPCTWLNVHNKVHFDGSVIIGNVINVLHVMVYVLLVVRIGAEKQ